MPATTLRSPAPQPAVQPTKHLARVSPTEQKPVAYPSSDHYAVISLFHERYLIEEISEGHWRARPRGEISIMYEGFKLTPGFFCTTFDADGKKTDRFNIFAGRKPVYAFSKDDFGYKLLCWLLKQGLMK